MIVILMILEVSFRNIYSTDITHDDHHDDCNIFIVQATGDSKVIRMMPSCDITYDNHSENSRGVIYAPRKQL
jgi:hypothetical protein